MSEAVLDAGPLIHLAELEALDTLMDFSALSLQHVFAPLPSPILLAMGRAPALDKGEMEALSLIINPVTHNY